MASTNLSHRRTHNVLLISKLLNQRENASPLTLVLDTLEQPAKPLIKEYIRRAKLSKTYTVFLGFETPHAPKDVDSFIPCWNKSPSQILQTVSSITSNSTRRCLLLIDSMMSLCRLSTQSKTDFNLIMFLSALMQPPPTASQATVSVVVVYHSDIPLHGLDKPYAPNPLSLLSYVATTIITVHSLSVLVAEKQARERSLGGPVFGLAQMKEGLVIGLKQKDKSVRSQERGIVLKLEHRRKSGRGVLEWYFLPSKVLSNTQSSVSSQVREHVSLLDDHPSFKAEVGKDEPTEETFSGVTFDLNLTDRQRLQRDGVVLPYFDAQQAGGGEGGRILYEMGAEDDFDEEEDEL